jgi:hypothetical protein
MNEISITLSEDQWRKVYSAVHLAKDYALPEYLDELEKIKAVLKANVPKLNQPFMDRHAQRANRLYAKIKM